MKSLYLMRHAKSDWKIAGLKDIERPLNARGKKSASFMGKLMKKMDEIPDLIISSPAKRAFSTAKKIASEINYPKEKILMEEKFYPGGIKEFLAVISSLNKNINKLLIVSHNPAITNFANFITGENIDNIPTAGIIRADFDIISWKEVSNVKGKMVFFEYPKKYRDKIGI